MLNVYDSYGGDNIVKRKVNQDDHVTQEYFIRINNKEGGNIFNNRKVI